MAVLKRLLIEWVILTKQKLLEIAEPLRKSGYGEYLINLVNKIMKSINELSDLVSDELMSIKYPKTPSIII